MVFTLAWAEIGVWAETKKTRWAKRYFLPNRAFMGLRSGPELNSMTTLIPSY